MPAREGPGMTGMRPTNFVRLGFAGRRTVPHCVRARRPQGPFPAGAGDGGAWLAQAEGRPPLVLVRGRRNGVSFHVDCRRGTLGWWRIGRGTGPTRWRARWCGLVPPARREGFPVSVGAGANGVSRERGLQPSPFPNLQMVFPGPAASSQTPRLPVTGVTGRGSRSGLNTGLERRPAAARRAGGGRCWGCRPRHRSSPLALSGTSVGRPK